MADIEKLIKVTVFNFEGKFMFYLKCGKWLNFWNGGSIVITDMFVFQLS